MLYKYESFFMISAVMDAEQLDRLVVFLQRASSRPSKTSRRSRAVRPSDPASAPPAYAQNASQRGLQTCS